jgi:hypothetical protein
MCGEIRFNRARDAELEEPLRKQNYDDTRKNETRN